MNIAIQGPKKALIEIEELLASKSLAFDKFEAEGFDGAAILTLLIDAAEIIAPAVAAVLAAKVATAKQVVLKVDGIEVQANTPEDAKKLIVQLTEGREITDEG
jgi:hypothetical protein